MVIVSSWRALAVPRGVHRLALAGLGREAIATLLSSVLPLEPDATAALASHFAAATDGHPAWILALVDRYRTDGVLVPSANGAWALHSLPDSAPPGPRRASRGRPSPRSATPPGSGTPRWSRHSTRSSVTGSSALRPRRMRRTRSRTS